jgi:hypothetical protein
MPIGYLITTGLMATWTLFALAPPRPRHTSPSNLSYWLGFLVNELPFVGFYWVVASTLLALAQGDLHTPVGWAGSRAVLAAIGLAHRLARAAAPRPSTGARGRPEWLAWRADAGMAARFRHRVPVIRSQPAAPSSRRRANDEPQLGDAENETSSISRHRSHSPNAPSRSLPRRSVQDGPKSRRSPLRLASQAGVHQCNYRLRPATFPDPST